MDDVWSFGTNPLASASAQPLIFSGPLNLNGVALKPAEARKVIRERAQSSLNIAPTRHALAQMRARKIDRLQVERCLQRGSITEGPYVPTNSRTGNWRCAVEARVSGDWVRVVVEIAEAALLEVITVIAVE